MNFLIESTMNKDIFNIRLLNRPDFRDVVTIQEVFHLTQYESIIQYMQEHKFGANTENIPREKI